MLDHIFPQASFTQRETSIQIMVRLLENISKNCGIYCTAELRRNTKKKQHFKWATQTKYGNVQNKRNNDENKYSLIMYYNLAGTLLFRFVMRIALSWAVKEFSLGGWSGRVKFDWRAKWTARNWGDIESNSNYGDNDRAGQTESANALQLAT